MKRMVILGSTGSVGQQGADVAKRHGILVEGICAGRNITVLEQQIRTFSPAYCAVVDPEAANCLRSRIADTRTKVLSGMEGILTMLSEADYDVALNAISGSAGLLPTLAVLRRGKDCALANKETLVVGGEFVMQTAKKHRARILPVDSEHSAIFQCLQGNSQSALSRILLTASGGPFYGKRREELQNVGKMETLAHPTWSMGAKITVDSATLMNKGFEVIEAVHLFSVSPKQVEVVVHRESVIHSMVEYCDGAILAQLGSPDMRTCIQYALTYPTRMDGMAKKLDFKALRSLTFGEADTHTFPLLAAAYDAISRGGIIPAVLNGANEQAVALFLQEKIRFLEIAELVMHTIAQTKQIEHPTLEDLMEADAQARRAVLKYAAQS